MDAKPLKRETSPSLSPRKWERTNCPCLSSMDLGQDVTLTLSLQGEGILAARA